MKTKENYYKDYLKALVGGKIVEVIVDASNEEYLSNPYLGFIVKKGKKTFQFVALRDPEGNGAGHMEITEIGNTNDDIKTNTSKRIFYNSRRSQFLRLKTKETNEK